MVWTYFVYSENVFNSEDILYSKKVNQIFSEQVFFVYDSYSLIWELFAQLEARAQYSFKTRLLPNLSEEFLPHARVDGIQ